MDTTDTNPPRKARLTPLVIYTAVLCLSAQLYAVLAEYELFLQILIALFYLFAAVVLLVLSIGCALFMAVRIPLRWLLGCHLLIACWWLASLYIQAPAGFRKFETVLSGYNIVFICAGLLPPLLGYALFKYRSRRIQAARANAQSEPAAQ